MAKCQTVQPELVWTSSDPGIATVDDDGYITFVNAGVTLITVRPVNNPNGCYGFLLD